MKTAFLAVLPFLVVSSPGFAQQATSEIEKANTKFEQAFNSGDSAAVAQMYTENAAVLPPDAEMAQGRAAIQNFWQGAIQGGIKNLSLKSTRVDELGSDAAREIGRFSLEAPGPQGVPAKVEGKYVVVWRKAGGDWKIDTDIWNADKPPAPAVATGGSVAPAAGSGAPR